jgi:antitoxin component of MazEF toxin-antitoxin module
MARRKIGKENIRNIQKSNGSYVVSIPIDLVRALGWQTHQRVIVTRSGKKLIITDHED